MYRVDNSFSNHSVYKMFRKNLNEQLGALEHLCWRRTEHVQGNWKRNYLVVCSCFISVAPWIAPFTKSVQTRWVNSAKILPSEVYNLEIKIGSHSEIHHAQSTSFCLPFYSSLISGLPKPRKNWTPFKALFRSSIVRSPIESAESPISLLYFKWILPFAFLYALEWTCWFVHITLIQCL